MEVARLLERRLFDHGCAVVVVPENLPGSALEALRKAGLLVLVAGQASIPLNADPEQAAESLFQFLENAGTLTHLALVEGEGILMDAQLVLEAEQVIAEVFATGGAQCVTIELSNRLRGFGSFDHAPAAGNSGVIPRHWISLRGNVCVSRSNNSAAAFEPR